jgi:histidine triad (HIT) family protein
MIILDCLFCKIVNGEIPSYKIYEDEVCIAFLDINPHSNGHTLIIPKKHFTDFTSLDSETLLHINMVAKNIATMLEEKLHITGLSLTTNYLDLQEVKHYHLHLVPRKKEEIVKVEEIYNKIKQ